MNALVKLIIGVVLLVVPLGMYAYEIINGVSNGITLPVLGTIHLWKSLITIIIGTVPGFVMLIGLFVVWLELDEMRIEKELEKEEKEEKDTKKATTAKTKSSNKKKSSKAKTKKG